MGWFWNKESAFSLSFGTKAILFTTSVGILLFGLGYALRPVAEIVEDLDDDDHKREIETKNEVSKSLVNDD